MNTYPIEIAGVKRELPLCKVNDELYIAAFVMFGDVEITVAAARELLKVAPEFDVIMTAEAKGIPLAYEMARQSGKYNYVVARKYPKLYMKHVFSADVHSITTDKDQTLYLSEDEANYLRGKRVLLVDDVISTGESIRGVKVLADKAGAEIVGVQTVLIEGDAQGRTDLQYLGVLPVFNPDGSIKK
ncbi:MAG: adenine phosphoribosyltransferase [Oscillospiraceae bacterium]|nr:adenine phosphoribosyltransferase [Oscillospiraceae bacterium]